MTTPPAFYTDDSSYISNCWPTYSVPTATIEGTPPTTDPLSVWQWNLRAMLENEPYLDHFSDAPRDVIVAVIDKWPGHHNHPDLTGVYLTGINLVEGGTTTSTTWDNLQPNQTNVHGQCAASMIAAQHNGSGMSGVFHRAKILPVRASITSLGVAILAAAAAGAEVIHIAGYEYDADQIKYLFPDHYLPALGARPAFPDYTTKSSMMAAMTSVRSALELVTANGVIVTTGIANRTGAITTHWIGSRRHTIAVGAHNALNQPSPFNSMSFLYDVFAPGGDPRGLSNTLNLPPNTFLWYGPDANADDIMCCVGPNKYSWMMGGSAAAPQVAAACAIMKSYNANIKYSEAAELLLQSSISLSPTLSLVEPCGGRLSLKQLKLNLL